MPSRRRLHEAERGRGLDAQTLAERAEVTVERIRRPSTPPTRPSPGSRASLSQVSNVEHLGCSPGRAKMCWRARPSRYDLESSHQRPISKKLSSGPRSARADSPETRASFAQRGRQLEGRLRRRRRAVAAYRLAMIDTQVIAHRGARRQAPENT